MTRRPDIDALRKALAAAEAKATDAEARAANAAAKVSDAEAEIAFLKLTIEKLRREMYGWRSECPCCGEPSPYPALRAKSVHVHPTMLIAG